ncbi:MAG: argininosuccinate lyase [Armatimonadetes bacterium]|nr:argininosuccinate lyase [Armatimonadota bacterium]
MKKLWSGRFQKETSQLVDDFHSSIGFDCRLYRQDIRGSIAHAAMLGRQGILTPEETRLIIDGLKEILAEIEAGRVEFSREAEDIHLNIEQLLIAKIGEPGKKLHTARSRNDQVALDVRLYLKEEIDGIARLLQELQSALLDLAEKHVDTVMPGYTHLQRAQPITFAHHLLAYVQMFDRDRERLRDCYRRTDVLPLGAGALAGTTLPIDPHYVARELGFSAVAENTLDAVSDRDFIVEFLAAAALIMVHLSRLGEEIVLWASAEFGFVELDDAYSTGSSMMPQKKNPDVAELVRGKAGRVFGDLVSLLTVLKGLPLAYNKDLQEDKEALFDAVDTVKKCLLVFRPLVATLQVNKEKMARAAGEGFTNATDLADYLVGKGVPFREAHGITGRIVYYCLQEKKTLAELALEEYKQFSPVIEGDVYQFIAIDRCVKARRSPGGPSPDEVRRAIARAKERLEKG